MADDGQNILLLRDQLRLPGSLIRIVAALLINNIARNIQRTIRLVVGSSTVYVDMLLSIAVQTVSVA